MTTSRILIVCLLGACGGSERRFPLRAPLERDGDLRQVHVKCRDHGCAPKEYKSPLYWDVLDNSVFRPTSEALAVRTAHESVNVNALDEVPDSAWFQNRIGRRPLTAEELALGGCTREQLLDPDAPDGAWLIDGGRDGSTPGFRIQVPGKGKYYVKFEVATKQPERQSAAAVIGSAVFHAAGYNVACEQLLYVRPSVFRLAPDVTYRSRFLGPNPYDRNAFAAEIARATKRDGLVRITASAWLPGHVIGPYRFIGTRDDDPNDVVPHEDRRELRAMRVLAAWLERHDAREMNTLDVWFADPKAPNKKSSPGHVVHYQIDTSDTLGAPFGGKPTSIRMGKSYLFDWTNIAGDLVTLGIRRRPWDDAKVTPGHELFGYFNDRDFVPELWKPEYPNPAFSRMTERDAAWMARILARFTPDLVQALAEMGNFTDPEQTKYLATVLQGRLDKILRRYLTRLSPIADLRIEDGQQLCGVNLAEWRGVRSAESFRYRARIVDGRMLAITRRPEGGVCVMLDHIARDGGARDDDPSRYLRVRITDGVARAPLVAHLYDLGPTRGFYLVDIQR